MNIKRKKLIGIVLVLVLLLGAGGYSAIYYYQKNQAEQTAIKSKSPDKLYSVVKGDLVVGIMLPGSINTKVKHKLALGAPLSTKLVSIVDENTKVAKGDIIARFETEELQTKIDDQKTELVNKEKDLQILLEERTILISSNEADIRSAEDTVSDAIQSYNRYRKLEGPQAKDAQQVKVADAYKALQEAEEKYTTAYNALYKPDTVITDEDKKKTLKSSLTSAQKARQSTQISYTNSLLDRKLFKQYTQPNKMKNLRDSLEQARLKLNKVRVQVSSSIAQKNNQIYSAKNNIKRISRDLESKLFYMGQMQLVAPANGIVTYGDPDRRWGNTEVKVGMDVRNREVLITIPDMSQMVVDINIPEQYRSKVKVGDSLIITPDSIPTLKVNGKIGKIASLPVLLIPWDQGSPKVYRSNVDFHSDDPRIVSGMSVQVEVISQIIPAVLSVPIESVLEENGKFFVYREGLTKPEKVEVQLGEANDNFVEIKSGLKEGNQVYLYRPFQSDKGK